MTIYTTDDIHVLSSPEALNVQGLDPCNHEKVDTQLFIHAAHASAQGLQTLMIHANDLDIVVLAVANFRKLSLDLLWIAFGSA